MHSCISDIEKGKAFLRLLHVLILRDFGMNNLGIIVHFIGDVLYRLSAGSANDVKVVADLYAEVIGVLAQSR